MRDSTGNVPQIPESVRIERAMKHANLEVAAMRMAGSLPSEDTLRVAYHSYLAGYDDAAGHAYEELLEENHALQGERLDIERGHLRVAALERFFDSAVREHCSHADGCGCWVCSGVRELIDE